MPEVSDSPQTAAIRASIAGVREVPKGENAETLGRLRGHLGTTGTAEVTVVLPLSRGERH